MDRAELEKLDRESLVQRAQAAGLKRARVLTRPELIDELLRRDMQGEPSQLRRSRGFFGIARDLLSRVVERGLHLPDAAERFRQALDPSQEVPRPEPQAIPTVTLAEIYASQGHKQRAVETLMRVLDAEPDHIAARSLLEKLQGRDYVPPREPLPPEPDYEPPPEEEADEPDEPVDAEPPIEPVEEVLPVELVAAPEADDARPDAALEAFASALLASESREAEGAVSEAALADAAPEHEPEEAVLSVGEPLTVALPEREVTKLVEDRCIAMGSYVWWQLSPASRRLAEESFFFLRIVTITPSWDGPQVATRDVAADPALGELVVPDLLGSQVVRVAVGFMPEGEFVPVAHSPAFELGPGQKVRQYTFDASTPNVLEDPLVLAVAQRAAAI